MSKLLEKANKKLLVRNMFTEDDMDLPMGKFLMKSYTQCTPNKYGDLFSKKVIYDSKNILKGLSASLNRGDCHMGFEKYFECKVSYLNKSGKYSITNIRNWQDFDYFILCFVDTGDNFKPYFYCVPKETITNNPCITLTGMNNTSDINSKNTYVGTRTSVNNVDLNWLFKNSSTLKGTSYKHLEDFIKKSRKNLK
jgi:hypothetical protein